MIKLLKEYGCVSEKDQINSDSFTIIPNSLICYSRDKLFSTWQILERQLEQLNPETDSDIHMALDAGVRFIFDPWLQFTGA
jgi:hypothetical protein